MNNRNMNSNLRSQQWNSRSKEVGKTANMPFLKNGNPFHNNSLHNTPGLTSISTMNFVVAIQTCPELENSSSDLALLF